MPVLLWGAAGAMLGLVFAFAIALVSSTEKAPTLGTVATPRRGFMLLVPLGLLLVLASFFH
jgi:hypothetical protein